MPFEKTKSIPCKAFAQLLLLVKISSIFNTINNESLKQVYNFIIDEIVI